MAGTAAYIDILPSLANFTTQLVSGTSQAAAKAGKQAGSAFASGMETATQAVNPLKAALDQATKKVATAETTVNHAKSAIAKANDDVKASTLRAEAAQKKYNDVVKKYGADSTQALNAEARLVTARSNLNQKTRQQATALDVLKAAQKGLTTAKEQATTAQKRLDSAEAQGTKSTTRGVSGVNRFALVLEKFRGRLSAAHNETNKLSEGESRLGSMSLGVAAKFSMVGNVVSSAWASITSNVSGAVSRVDQLNNFPLVMKNLGYSSEDAAKSIKHISSALDGLPSSSSEVAGMVQQLAPLTKNLDEATNVALAFNDALLAGGASTVDQTNAMTQFTQMLSAGKVDMMAWRSVENAMPGQLNQLSAALLGAGHNSLDLYNAMQKGQVSFQQFNDAVVKLDKEGGNGFASFAKQAKDATGGIGTAMTNVRNRIQKAIADIIQNIGANRISAAVNKFSSSFTVIGTAVGKQVAAIMPAITPVAGKMMTAFEQVTTYATQHSAALTGVIRDVLNVAVAVGTAVGKQVQAVMPIVLPAVKQIIAYAQQVATALQKHSKEITSVATGVVRAAIAVGSAIGAQAKALIPKVMPVVRQLLSFAQSIVGFVQSHATLVTRTLTLVLEGFLAFKAVKTIATVFATLSTVIKGVSVAMRVLNIVTKGSPWGIVATLIALVIAKTIQLLTQTKQGQAILKKFGQVVKNVAEGAKKAWNSVSATFSKVMQNIRTWWNNTSKSLQNGWNKIYKNVVAPFIQRVKDMGNWFNRFYTDHIKPVWDWVTSRFNQFMAWFNKVFRPAWNAGINLLATIMHNVGNTIHNVWNGISNAFHMAWNWINSRVIQPFRRGMDSVGTTAQHMRDMVSHAWNAIKDAAATPVRFVVNTVYMNGIRKVWNGVADAVGLHNLELPAAHFATGGVMQGYAPGVDSIHAMVSPGEAIMVPEWTQAIGTENILRWNAIARNQGVDAVRRDMTSPTSFFANGGVVGAIKNAGTTAINWVKNVSSNVKDFITSPKDWLRDHILNPVTDQLSTVGNGNWGRILTQLPLRVIHGMMGKVKEWADSIRDKFIDKTPQGGQYHGKVGAGVEQWRGTVLQALKELHQPASWADTVLRRMNQESGGNPNAINNWDSNAAAGIPSQGLMQTIPPTFAAYAGPYAGRSITDPLANIYAGINYSIHRYGSIAGMNRAGGYAKGGIIPELKPTLYDTGGKLNPGLTLVSNQTGKPETVLTAEQTADMHKRAQTSVTQNITINETHDPYAEAAIWMRELKDTANRG